MKTRGGNSAMLTPTDVADFLEVDSNTARRRANKDSIHAYRWAPRRGRRFKRENVDRFVRHNDFQSG
ncbi:MAG: helix-turn-helix domain-containing protein [Chloroflexi bacterium]|jgi:excisionase family DNA binding protein|nr:helix-turn-helix domain-containing protein [Chloroflexota bacterium]